MRTLFSSLKIVGLLLVPAGSLLLAGRALFTPAADSPATPPDDAMQPFAWTLSGTDAPLQDGWDPPDETMADRSGPHTIRRSSDRVSAAAFQATTRYAPLNCRPLHDAIEVVVAGDRIGIRLRRPAWTTNEVRRIADQTRQAGYRVSNDDWGPDAVLWMRLLGTHAGARSADFDAMLHRPPGLVRGGIQDWLHLLPAGTPRLHYADIRPGVDFLFYHGADGDELVFIVWPGANIDSLTLWIENLEDVFAPSAAGALRLWIPGGEFGIGAPRLYRTRGDTVDTFHGQPFWNGRAVELPIAPPEDRLAKPLRDRAAPRPDPTREDPDDPRRAHLEPTLRLVPGGGQPDGPPYPFYLSETPVINIEFVQFLNDAQQHPDQPRGTNMVFDAAGNVWIHPDMRPDAHEMFSIRHSRIRYDPDAPVGQRYRITPRQAEPFGSYTNHPVAGVSWYGAVKYNNWLTIATGRGADERCYREGPEPLDWAPVTSAPTNWARGRFTDAERIAWLDRKGFRLPMDPAATGTVVRAGMFNEYYKAGAWNGVTNVLYGFGRNVLTPLDANTQTNKWLDTLPAGFYDGHQTFMGQTTASNENWYGLYDLSGNVAEWLTEPFETDPADTRMLRSGSGIAAGQQTHERAAALPHHTSLFSGFRVSSLAADMPLTLIRIPFWICLAGHAAPVPAEELPFEPEAPRDPFAEFPPPVTPPTIIPRPPSIPPVPPVPPIRPPPIRPPPVSPALL